VGRGEAGLTTSLPPTGHRLDVRVLTEAEPRVSEVQQGFFFNEWVVRVGDILDSGKAREALTGVAESLPLTGPSGGKPSAFCLSSRTFQSSLVLR